MANSTEILHLLKDQFDDRLFFMSYANVHCSHQVKPFARSILLKPPPKLIVNMPLSYFDAFSQVFKCKPGSKMNPHKKCPFK